MKLIVYESNTSPSTYEFEAMLSRYTETIVDITPKQRMCSKELSKTSIAERKCVYEYEKTLRYD